MIIFLYKYGHVYTHDSLIGNDSLGEIQCKNYSWLLGKKKSPKGTYIFTDLERMDLWELRVYGELFHHFNNSGAAYRAINNPAKMMNRRVLLRALYLEGINDFNAYSLVEKTTPKKFPVFLRREYDHGVPLTGLLENKEELKKAIKKLQANREPIDGVLIVEYCAEPIEATLFRKLQCYRVGDEVIFHHCSYEHSWFVKYGVKNTATDALDQDEYKMVRNNAFEQEIRRVFLLSNIEYGSLDFGIVNGRVQVYEINTNPYTLAPHCMEYKTALRKRSYLLAWEKYCKALSELDNTDSSGDYALRFTHPELLIPKNSLKLLYKKPFRFFKLLLLCKDASRPRVRR